MDTDEKLMLKYIYDVAQECRNFLDHSDYANTHEPEHMLRLSIIGHNLTAKFEHFEALRIREKLKNDGK